MNLQPISWPFPGHEAAQRGRFEIRLELRAYLVAKRSRNAVRGRRVRPALRRLLRGHAGDDGHQPRVMKPPSRVAWRPETSRASSLLVTSPRCRLLSGLSQEIWREPNLGAVVQRASRVGRRGSAKPGAVLGRHVGMAQHDVVGDRETAPSPCNLQREMDACRECIRQSVKRERALVRDDTGQLGPQPGGDELLMLACREMNHPIDASPHPDDLPGVDVCPSAVPPPVDVSRTRGNHGRLPRSCPNRREFCKVPRTRLFPAGDVGEKRTLDAC